MLDPYRDNDVLAIPVDGVDGSTLFSDLKGKTVTPYGNARVSTTQSKFGGSSAYFDGAGDYLSIADSPDWDVSGDHTIELFFFLTATSGVGYTRGIIGTGTFESSAGFTIGHYQDKLAVRVNSTNYRDVAPIILNAWHHVALVWLGSSFVVYLDGTAVHSGTAASVATSTSLIIGNVSPIDANRYSQVYIDDIRITKGVARYTGAFTPPSVSYLSNNVGTITPPLHSIEAAGIAPIVGVGQIIPVIESVAGSDGAIVASGEVSPPLETISASGTSQAEPATNYANVVPKIESISGYGSTSVVGFGSIVPKRRGTVSGSGISGEWVGDGRISPRLEQITASGGTSIIGRAYLEGKNGAVNGAGSSAVAGMGRIIGRVAAVSGQGFIGVGGSAQIQALKDVVSGSGTSYISGYASIVPPKEEISASKYTSPANTTFNFSRGPVVTGSTPAPPVEPLHFSR